MKIYTKTGDDGTTGLRGGGRVQKDAPRVHAYGDVDELNASLGVVLALLPNTAHAARGWLERVQNDLFVIGALLATPAGADPKLALDVDSISALENAIDKMEEELPALKNFILPQGGIGATNTHLARSIARRAERSVVALNSEEAVDVTILIFLNRLSDFLFVLARWINRQEGAGETAWIAASAQGRSEHQASGGDRLSASLRKLDDEKRKRLSLFEQTAADLQKKKLNAQKAFEYGVDKINREGGTIEPDVRPIDLD